MRVTPKTEQEIAEENLLPDGVYDFEIKDAEEALSKRGNEMIKLTLRLFDASGDPHSVIFDYLLDSTAYKVRHCAEACGLLAEYELGHLRADDLKEKCGRVRVSTQKDKSGQYPDRNVIKDYMKPETIEPTRSVAQKPKQLAAADLDDEIPF